MPAYIEGVAAFGYAPGADAIAAALPKALSDIVNSVLSTGMAVAALIGLTLDNLIPASDEERGIIQPTVK
ncbi:MAG: hypothetical protein IIA58_02940 [Candidatus Marinimicrobia bacterium]|nr:hypothetical protein [Candidatus Neomarinimicrobiota bacterium]